MVDNKKVERILLLRISVAQKFSEDLYYGDFLVHPMDTPITEEDMDAFRMWKIEELELRGNTENQQSLNEDFMVSTLRDSLSIMQRDIGDMQQAQALYREICNFVSSSHQIIGKQWRFSAGDPLHTIKQFVEQIRHMGFSILRFQEFQTEESYIEIHSVNSFILTVALANAAKMAQYRLINLALAAMFHEVGLTKFANLISHDKHLSPQEFQLQKAHVPETMNLLEIYNFPSEVMEGISQHHERLDGSGYPHGVTGGEITDFGRYLGLVCSYIAMIAEQEFRESRLAHTAILTLLKGAKIHYDAELVRLLVQLLSLYPVGSYVALSNGAIGRVLRNNQKNPRLPIIQVLFGPDYKPIARSTVIQTSEKICVAQPISYKKIAPLIARIQENKS